MIGVDLINPKTRKPLEPSFCREIFDDCLKAGLLTMAYTPALRINPPLSITLEEALHGADVLEQSLKVVASRHGF